jgi:hypothetical protein
MRPAASGERCPVSLTAICHRQVVGVGPLEIKDATAKYNAVISAAPKESIECIQLENAGWYCQQRSYGYKTAIG